MTRLDFSWLYKGFRCHLGGVCRALFFGGMLLASPMVSAQRVVVLEFEGDSDEKLRRQVEKALRAADEVSVVSLASYKEAAERKRVKPADWMTARGVVKIAPSLALAAVVEGEVASGFQVRIRDPRGEELWSRELPLKRGLVSKTHAEKLAKAIAAAARLNKGASKPLASDSSADETPTSDEDAPEGPSNNASTRGEWRDNASTPEETDRTSIQSDAEGFQDFDRRLDERDTDIEAEATKRKTGLSPKMLTLTVQGTTTWRHYCSRPGVKDCKSYEELDEGARPLGDTVEFSAQVPYAGFSLGANLLPFAGTGFFTRGLGVAVGYSQGFSQTNVKVSSTQGDGPEETVVSNERHIEAFGLYRLFFQLGQGARASLGYVGLRGGYSLRSFSVAEGTKVPLPGSHRSFPSAGVEVSIPLSKFFRVEGGGSYFFSPTPSLDEIRKYGDVTNRTGGAVSSGYGYQAGVSGDLWGPLGYSVQLRVQTFSDLFVGAGEQWPCIVDGQCGGAAEETYATLHWGVTASF